MMDFQSESSSLGMKRERRSAIELKAARMECEATGIMVRWCHSEAQLADGLSKPSAWVRLWEFFRKGQSWRLVVDDSMRSSRNRRKEGLDTLE